MSKRNLHCESQKQIRDGVVGVMAFYLCSQNIYQKYSFLLFFLPLTAFPLLCTSSLQLSSSQMLIYCYSVTFHIIALSCYIVFPLHYSSVLHPPFCWISPSFTPQILLLGSVSPSPTISNSPATSSHYF